MFRTVSRTDKLVAIDDIVPRSRRIEELRAKAGTNSAIAIIAAWLVFSFTLALKLFRWR